MSVVEAVAALGGAFAWPLVVLALGLVFRKPISRLLLGEAGRLRAGPLEFEWSKAKERIGPAVQSLPSAGRERIPEADAATAEISPRTAVVSRFADLMGKLVHPLVQATGRNDWEDCPPSDILDIAADLGVISAPTKEALVGLLVLRNLAAHSPGEMSEARATDFLHLAEAVEYAVSRNVQLWDQRSDQSEAPSP